MTLLATLLSADTDLKKYYPHHLPTAPTYGGVALLVIFAVLSIIKKIIFLALILVIVAVALALYHHGTLNQLFHTGAKYKAQVQSGS